MSRVASRSLATHFLVVLMAALLATAWLTAYARPVFAASPYSLTTLGSPYSQNFNALSTLGTTNALTIDSWEILEGGNGGRDNEQYAVDNGGSTTGDVYSYGTTGSGERALGQLRSGSLIPTIGASFTNNTGATIQKLDIAYTGEGWRLGADPAVGTPPRGADAMDFQYSLNATSLSTGTWVDANALDFVSPLVTPTGAKDGNAVGNKTAISSSITGLTIANGATFWIRWTDRDPFSSDDGLAIDDFSLTPKAGDDLAPTVTGSSPANNTENVPNGANITITFSESVTVADPWFDLTCTASGTHTAAVSGTGDSRTLNPDTDFTDLETCTVTIDNTGVADADSDDPPDTMAADASFTFQVGPECNDGYDSIHDIQGAGTASPKAGQTVATEGVVVGDFEGPTSGGLQGFYIQEPDADGNDLTSEGLFVFTGDANNGVAIGDYVRISSAVARERFNQTALNGANTDTSAVNSSRIFVCSSGNSIVPTDVFLPVPNATYLERFEGMSVRFPQDLVIAEYFDYDRFGEIVLALPIGDETRPFTPTSIEEPGSPEWAARNDLNLRSRITLDDGLGVQNPAGGSRHPGGGLFSLGNPEDPFDGNRFRGGDTLANTVGVLGFDFSRYRIQPTSAADYTPANPRPAEPEDVGGSVRLSAMNTLNFFITPDISPSGGPLDNVCGGLGNLECRGWDSDQPAEFDRQRDKLLQALAGIGADVLGLNELENSPVNDPLGHPTDGIVAGLNELLSEGTYDYIDTGIIGTDAIRVGLIYKPGVVTPVGDHQILDSTVDPRFIDTKSRPALAQTFYVNETGARFTVVVNHLKSKGSACLDVDLDPGPGVDPDNDEGLGAGNCNKTRELAAEALVDWLATDPTNSGDPDFVIMGDLNSYAMEDPIDAIKAGADDELGTDDDYTNLIDFYQGTYAYSYTFDGMAGYLDHSLGNASFSEQVTGAAEWHINSDEPDLIDYDTSFKSTAQDAIYEPNQYRTSDHDPVIVGTELVNAAPTFEAVVAAGCTSNGGTYNITIDDYDLLETELTLTRTGNTNTTLVPNANVSVTGSGANRTITMNAAANESGTAVVTFTLSDGWNDVDLVITLQAGSGDDTLVGTSGEDILLGGAGDDSLSGLGGADILCAGKGEDSLVGGDGNDWLDAGDGDDTLTGGAGGDLFIGGKGVDVDTDFDAGDGDTSNGT